MDKTQTERLPYVDIAKGIGILLVVLGHNGICHSGTLVATAIYSFHMPLFFFLAGLFHEETRTLVSHMARKSKSLVLPCFLVFMAWLTVQAAKNQEALFRELRSILFNTLWGTGKTMFWGQLWFLTSLFMTTSASHLLIRSGIVCNKVARGILALLLLPLGTWFLDWGAMTPYVDSFWINGRYYYLIQEGLPWNIDLLPITCSFYLLGTIFPKRRFGRSSIDEPFAIALALAAFLAVIAGSLFMNWGINLNLRQYDHWAGSSLLALSGIAGVLLLSLGFGALSCRWPRQILSFLGKRSLWILVLHFTFQQNSLVKITSMGLDWTLACAISLIIGVTVPLVILELWKRLRKKMMTKTSAT